MAYDVLYRYDPPLAEDEVAIEFAPAFNVVESRNRATLAALEREWQSACERNPSLCSLLLFSAARASC